MSKNDYMFYDLLDPPRNQHVFFDTYLDYARILLANLEAHRLHVHPMLTGAHVSAAAWWSSSRSTIQRRSRNGRTFGDPPGNWPPDGSSERLVGDAMGLHVHDREQGVGVDSAEME